MAIFATGAGTPQTTSVTTSSAQIFNTAASGLSGTLKNVLVCNAGTVTAYVGAGNTNAAAVATSFPLAPGQELLLIGTALNLYAITNSGTTTLIAGLATLATTD